MTTERAPISRRSLLALAWATASSVVLAACGGAAEPLTDSSATGPSAKTAPPSSTAASASPVVKPGAQPKPGGVLRARIVGDLTSVDGQQSIPSVNATIGYAYEALIRYDDKSQPKGMLAESWDLSADGKQIKISLRKGVQFHNGRDFTSDDVAYSFNRLKDPKVAAIVGQIAGQASWWTTIDTPDKYTILLKSEAARPGVFDFLQYATIVDKNLMEGPDAKTNVNGTGPSSSSNGSLAATS
jgi:ABC-type transport system substrate-binding protein